MNEAAGLSLRNFQTIKSLRAICVDGEAFNLCDFIKSYSLNPFVSLEKVGDLEN